MAGPRRAGGSIDADIWLEAAKNVIEDASTAYVLKADADLGLAMTMRQIIDATENAVEEESLSSVCPHPV